MNKRYVKWLLVVLLAVSVFFCGCGQLAADLPADVAESGYSAKTGEDGAFSENADESGFYDENGADFTESDVNKAEPASAGDEELDPSGTYTSRDEVALYLHLYGQLPSNFITKKEAKALGWPGGSLEDYAPGKSIGGDVFGNYEGNLPAKKGRIYHECDIDTGGNRKRGAKRIVFSNDGLIYYTEDHYETFTLLYGDE